MKLIPKDKNLLNFYDVFDYKSTKYKNENLKGLFMKKVALILFVVLLAQVQVFACQYAEFRSDLLAKVVTQVKSYCVEKTVNLERNFVDFYCADKQLYRVNFENNQIYFVTTMATKHPYTSQCWIEGAVTSSCQVQFKPQKCESWTE